MADPKAERGRTISLRDAVAGALVVAAITGGVVYLAAGRGGDPAAQITGPDDTLDLAEQQQPSQHQADERDTSDALEPGDSEMGEPDRSEEVDTTDSESPPEPSGCVTRSEFDAAPPGASQQEVEEAFDATPVAVGYEGRGDHAYMSCDALYVAVMYFEDAVLDEKKWVTAP